MKKLLSLLLVVAIALAFAGYQYFMGDGGLGVQEGTFFSDPTLPAAPTVPTASTESTPPEQPLIDKDGAYNTKEDVALYIITYGCLPLNYVTKKEANAMGCDSLGRIEDYVKHGAIGGDIFQNREGLLPKKSGRIYYECDIDTWGKTSRGAKRIVFSNDGLVYYTDDHYETFTLLYGEP